MRKFTALPTFFKNQRLGSMAALVSFIAVVGAILAWLVNWVVGIIWVILVVIALIVIFKTLQDLSEQTTHYIENLSYRINRGEQESIIQMPLGVMLFTDNGDIEWVNPYLQQLLGEQTIVGQNLKDVSNTLTEIVELWSDNEKRMTECDWLDHFFQVQVQPELNAIYLMDMTASAQVTADYENHKLFLGIVSLDNYDEVTEGMSDAEASTLRTYVTKTLSDWMTEHDIYARRLSVDRYLLVGYRESLIKAENDKFNLLKVIRESTSMQNTQITLSIGIAYNEMAIDVLAENAQSNLDLALGRGGDQVVVKSSTGSARFYGGNTNPMAKRTRVRARVISQALADLFDQADQVFVMGHKRPDMDSFGGALGVRRLAEMLGKPAWVVYEETGQEHSDIRLLLDQMATDASDENAILAPDDVIAQMTDQSLLVIVDHSKPSLSESKDVYEAMKDSVVIIDHHRRGEEFPDEAQLVYVESYASSTSELVTELFEYQPRRAQGLRRLEATAMLAGIQIDTKSFTLRSGTRTFDAASYLRAVGADGSLLQDFMKESVGSYRQRAHLIERAKIHDSAAIVTGEDDIQYDSVVAAQAADSLLQMIGVQSAYVISRRDNNTVAVSARSTGNVSVQLVMEAMGGGGHLSNAATQVKDTTTDDVYELLLTKLNKDNDQENE
ncbi:c-di-AMP phosphodiesterase, consists of a GGDEF-like and DHH domains [Weissella hellenica]|uniref:Cyclic-di-AMP phosphodiesterase n=1 Tax=Weissella hellenica TaxID=46256 RepID=A0ABY0K2Q3_WEIHE|nr:DHH family phosphoesterase [Weissella hellenica]GED35911.1 DHH family phosphoesterase [Weissella hellenica]SCB91044.1 c-di-AMP phosphodiesterase, consists of a GGDEF-like and DHH domains [Weissella hellenica]